MVVVMVASEVSARERTGTEREIVAGAFETCVVSCGAELAIVLVGFVFEFVVSVD